VLLIAFSLIFGSLAHGDGAPNTAASDEPRVTLSFSGADLLETLYRLFQGTGFSYEAPRNTPETFSVDLENVPLETALRVVLEPRGFTFAREGRLYRIARREGHRSVSEQLEEEERALERRRIIESIQRLPRREPRPRVRFAHAPALAGFAPRPVTGMPPGTYLNGSWAVPAVTPYPRRVQPAPPQSGSQALRLGPLTLPLPEGFRLLPGGGFELALPAEGTTSIQGPLGSYTIPFTAPGIVIRRR
jgi:hypothetical protein